MQKINKFIHSQSFISLTIQLSGFALSFVLSIVLTNLFDANIYGDYVLIYSTIDMFAILSLMGYNQLFSIEVPKIKTDEERFGLFIIAKRKSLLNSFIISVGLLIFGFFYLHNEKNLSYLIISSSLILPFLGLTVVNTNFLYSLRESTLPQLNDKIFRIIFFILFLLIFYSFSNSIIVVVLAFLLSSFITFLISRYLRKKRISYNRDAVQLVKKKINNTIYLLIVINAINLLFSKTDAFQLAYFLGADHAGVNNIYMKMSHVINLVMSSSLLIFSPKISKVIAQQRFDLVRRELKKVFRFALPVSLVMLTFVLIFTPFLLQIYASNLYLSHWYSVPLYCLSAILGILIGPAAMVLMLSNKLKALIIGFIFELLLNFLLNATLIPYFSIEGAAIATVISELAVNLYFSLVCYHYFRLNTSFFGK